MPLRRAAPSSLTRCIGWRKNNRPDHPIFHLYTFIKTGSESIDANILRRQILLVRFVARMENMRLSKCVVFGELVEDAGCVGGRKKGGWSVSWTAPELSESTPTSGWLQPRTRENGAGRWNELGKVS